MRVVYAWFLLLVSVSNWIGGHLCFGVSYYVEIQHEMDAAERAIAEELKSEVGIDGFVKILDEEDLSPRGKFYDAFSFSKELNGETVFYTVADESKAVTYEKVNGGQQTPPQHDSKTVLLKSLFKEFPVQAPDLKIPETTSQLISLFHHLDCRSQVIIAIPSPPPDLA
jgi:hypothetical protein